MERIKIPKFCGEITLHKEIADISREAHRVAEDAEQLREMEKQLNSKVNELLLGQWLFRIYTGCTEWADSLRSLYKYPCIAE